MHTWNTLSFPGECDGHRRVVVLNLSQECRGLGSSHKAGPPWLQNLLWGACLAQGSRAGLEGTGEGGLPRPTETLHPEVHLQ